ncbi:metalloregulator ArsR/SmtB family transcription factor [uncultured Sphingomonas sp.]|uniref:ArsR/SmtB family transcription factor n=1 Tax=uncultured Sphingomonas sp. TaxID=158754 RepID=UPI0025F75712|nr:metalloregulator ArsR/SmtB family transcription factor [uncultured Sphingomonas sp.]
MSQPNLPIFTALGQQTRWRAFEVLLEHGDKGLLQREIAAALGIEKNLMSVHLRILKEADLVSAEKNGREVTYRVTPAAAREAAEILLRTIEGGKSA